MGYPEQFYADSKNLGIFTDTRFIVRSETVRTVSLKSNFVVRLM